MITRTDFDAEFEARILDFERLRLTTDSMIRNALDATHVDYISVESRVKAPESAYKKLSDKSYIEPFVENTDFIGLRIIVFLERDIDKVASLLDSLFEVDVSNSIDKRTPERVDSVGYRSLHLVCKLGKPRANLPEYLGISEQSFEIQIRTALQHAWAEIEHKRRYKGNFSLPNDLQHRLMIVSGTLELVDREFSEIANRADEYASSLSNAQSHAYADDAISQVAIQALFETFITDAKMAGKEFRKLDSFLTTDKIVSELKSFGVKSVEDIRNLIKSLPNNFIDIFNQFDVSCSTSKFYRVAMLNKDFEKYFENGAKDRFEQMNQQNFDMLNHFLTVPNLEERFTALGIEIIPF